MQKTIARGNAVCHALLPELPRHINPSFIMKLSICVMTLVVLSTELLVASPGHGQKMEEKVIRLELNNETLRGALFRIEQLSGFKIAYLLEHVSKYKGISITGEERTVEATLRLVLRDTKLAFRQEDNTILVFPGARIKTEEEPPPVYVPADITVSGKVTNSAGEPLQGVAITVKDDRNRGAVSDAAGIYKITLDNNNAILVFSYIGMETQEVPLAGKSVVNVSLQETAAQQKEVIVVGYGTQKRRELTSSISTINSKEINELPVTELGQALQGRVAGVTVTNVSSPGTAPDIRIRGVSSVSFATDPLYVIDGFPTTNLSSFDNKDVESVEVLKDASAAAIYGSRATNGVILITTKKGGRNARLRVNLDSYVGIESAWRLLRPMTTSERSRFMDGMYAGDNIDDASKRPSRYTTEEMNKFPYPGATQTYAQTNTDWQGLHFKTGLLTNHNLSLSGGGESSRFYSSAGYMKQDGILIGVGFERYNFRINSTHDIGSRFTFGQNLLLSYTKQRYSSSDGETGDQGTPLSLLQFALPHLPLRDPNTGYWIKAGGDGVDGHPFPNLVADIENSSNFKKTVKILGSAYLDVKLTPSLKFRTTFGIDYADGLNNAIRQSYTVNDGFSILKTDDGLTSISNNRRVFTSLLFSEQLTFDKTFNHHHINAVLVYEGQTADIKSEIMSGRQSSPGLTTLNGASAISAVSNREENLLLSYVARIAYGYKGKYMLNASIRRDGSSVWAPGNKFANFPAVSAGWNIARESFLEKSTTVSDLKLRASYGITGLNPTALGNYPWQSLIYNSAYPFNNVNNVNTAFYNKLSNQNLEWEKTSQLNIGLDAGFLNDRISLTVEYYDRITDNLILKAPTPPSFGYIQSTDVNIGKMQNKGWEFQAGYHERNRPFKWGVTANLGIVSNQVLRLDAPSGAIFGGEGNYFSSWGVPVTRTVAGESIQPFYGWVFDRIYQSQAEVNADNEAARAKTGNAGAFYQASATAAGDVRFKDINGDGIVDDRDREKIGSFLPDFTYGLNLTAAYKNFDISILFQGVQGGEIFSAIGVYSGAFRWPLGGSLKAFEDAWTSANPSTTNPRIRWSDPNDNSRISKRWLQDASYLRLKNISIGYEIPFKQLDQRYKGAITKFRVYAASQNLLTFTGYDLGYDPEIGMKIGSNRGAGNLTNGIDYGQYPAARSFILGLQVGF
ncbi:SusC/RagA family TonB-linked outer membrane protein [Foetidibacter luteolus]|uniref:SusC/RagA family TonB-linked outer membrane protein n=1 Tax=Foetidibacter luteolus TaxID=2608880 RepID=UPI00129BD392|nr:TonB-dependent receptor [Foetidibacter luteolus]